MEGDISWENKETDVYCTVEELVDSIEHGHYVGGPIRFREDLSQISTHEPSAFEASGSKTAKRSSSGYGEGHVAEFQRLAKVGSGR